MILLILNAALQSSISVLLLKLGFEMIWNKENGGHFILVPTMLVCAVANALYNLHLLNLAMKYFNQMEAVPIY